MNTFTFGLMLGLFVACLTLIGGYLWGASCPEDPETKQPEWRKDTVDGAIEWAMAALDARKEKL